MQVCFDRRWLGSDQHLLVNSVEPSIQVWVEEVPDHAYYLSGELKVSSRCLDTILKLNGIDEISNLPELDSPAARAMSWVLPELKHDLSLRQKVRWQHSMAHEPFSKHLRIITSRVMENLPYLNLDYHVQYFVITEQFLSSLGRATIDETKLASYLERETNESNLKTLRSFQSEWDSDRVSQVKYNRFGSRTGRLTVEQGPQILTLKKEYRDVITSQHGKDGTILYVDFKALEARVLLSLAGKRVKSDDVYGEIAHDVFKGKHDRDLVKQVVLSKLYGSGARALSEKLNLSEKQLKPFLQKILVHFNVKEIVQKLHAEHVRYGYIRNFYGRKIWLPEGCGKHLLLNYHVQSTAVEVALLGFDELVKNLVGLRATPLFVLHDALFLDVYNLDLARTRDVIEQQINVPLMLNLFPCSITNCDVGFHKTKESEEEER